MRLLVYILLPFLLLSCNDSQQVDAVNASTSTLKKVGRKYDDAAVNTVNNFYQSISEKHCDKAVLLRPKYTTERCKSLSKININTVRQEYNDGLYAVMYLNIDFSLAAKRQHFNGYLWLKKHNEKWEIQEGFSSVDRVTYEQFFETYIPQNKSNKISPARKIVDDEINDSNQLEILARLRENYPNYANSKIILVDVSQQQLMFYDENNKLISRYPISTASKGVGNKAGSDQTPLGAHIISDRFGGNADYGSVFISRVNTGKIANIISRAVNSSADLVTSRILWLEGLDVGKNKGGRVDSHNRYIYIHGTQEEGLIGQPASHGCIRMKNNDVIELFQQAVKNTLVYIGE